MTTSRTGRQSLFALAKERGRHFRELKQEMDDAGAEPVFDAEKAGATFYRREVANKISNNPA
jgi:hypothetical protein